MTHVFLNFEVKISKYSVKKAWASVQSALDDAEMDLAETKERFCCNQCGNPTWHSLLGRQSVTLPLYSGEEQIGDCGEQWDLFQCLGCDNIALRVTGDYPWKSDLACTFFPERTTEHHQSKRYRKLPKKLKSIYEEVVTAFNRRSLVLCTAGIRPLLEGLCADKGIAQVQMSGASE